MINPSSTNMNPPDHWHHDINAEISTERSLNTMIHHIIGHCFQASSPNFSEQWVITEWFSDLQVTNSPLVARTIQPSELDFQIVQGDNEGIGMNFLPLLSFVCMEIEPCMGSLPRDPPPTHIKCSPKHPLRV